MKSIVKEFRISILAFLFLALVLSGCAQPVPEPPVEEPPRIIKSDTGAETPTPPIIPPSPDVWYGNMEGFAEEYGMSNWAWGIIDLQSEIPTNIVVAAEYASQAAFEDLTIAVGTPGIIPVEYAGEKEGTGEFYWPLYSPTYKVVTGASWKTTETQFPVVWTDYVLLPASCEAGILLLTYPSAPSNPDWEWGSTTEFYNHDRPPAEPADIAKMEALKDGHKVVHSEQLALSSDGGRISLFQYETIYYGLVIIAYINGDKVIATESIASANDGVTQWHSELPPETYPSTKVSLLYQSDAGLVIGFTEFGPESDSRYLLAERDGRFLRFSVGDWRYDVWQDPQLYIQNTDGLIDSETWPPLKPEDLIGAWTGESLFTFNADGTGKIHGNPITYFTDDNIIVIDIDSGKSQPYYRCLRAKIEGNQLFIHDIYNYYYPVSECQILTKK